MSEVAQDLFQHEKVIPGRNLARSVRCVKRALSQRFTIAQTCRACVKKSVEHG